MADLIVALRAASQAKVDESLRPVLERVTELRKSLESFERAAREESEGGVINEALRALGQPLLEMTSDASVEKYQLRTALADLLCFLGDDDPVSKQRPEPVAEEPSSPPEPESVPEPIPEPVVVQPKPASLKLKTKPTPEPSTLNVDRAWKLIREVENFAETDFTKEHPIRLQYLFQAFAAECRHLMEQFPVSHEMLDTLGERVIRTVTRLKSATGVQPFIKGLAFSSQSKSENWYRIASEARKKVQKFDQDAAESPSSSRKTTPKTNGKTNEAPPKVSYTWPELPMLRKMMADTGWPLLIVGGSWRDQPKLDTIKERFGVECEWINFSSNNARIWDAVADRIVLGKIAGAMLVEGFMSHKAYRRIMKAADQNPGVPISMAGKGGVAAFEEALKGIERQIAILVCKIPLIEAK